jgi:hypothetical protein
MDAREKIEILDALRRSRQSFLGALNGVTEDLAARSPGANRWSILQCAEHVAVSEDYLFSLITQAKGAEVPVVNKSREAVILARGADRSRPGVSPEAVRPTGRFSTLTDAVLHFLASRDETIRFVESCAEDLRSKLTTHPLLGPVNCHEVLLLMVVHPERHAMQIDEVRAAGRGLHV